MRKIHSRSSPTVAPKMVTELVGNDEIHDAGLTAENEIDDFLSDDEESQRRNDLDQAGGVLQSAHLEEVEGCSQGTGHDEPGGNGDDDAEMPVLVQLVEDVGRHHAHGSLGKIHDPRSAIDEDQPDRRDGVQRPGPEPDDGELEDLAHPISISPRSDRERDGGT